MSGQPEIIEAGSYRVAKYRQGMVAVQTPDGKCFADLASVGFADTTLAEHFDSRWEDPLQAIVELAQAVQYSPKLLHEFRGILVRYFVPRVLSPIMHIHHQRLAVKNLNLWHPLTPWQQPETQFSRVCIDADAYRVYGSMLKYQETGPGEGLVICKFKRDVPLIADCLEATPLRFENAWESLEITAHNSLLEPFVREFEAPEVTDPVPDDNVPYRLISEINEEEAPWALPFMYAAAVYVYSDFCRDPIGEQAAFRALAGPSAEVYLSRVWDHHAVRKDRFDQYEKANRFTTLNDVGLDFVHPCLAPRARPFRLTVELQEYTWPDKRKPKKA